MKKRFEGENGKRRLIEVIESCHLVKNDKALAEKLSEIGEIVEVKKDTNFISEGNDDNDIYFILAGEAEVLIKNNHIGFRKVGDAVGEMAIVNPSEPRSATLKAISDIIVLKLTEFQFSSLADEYSHLWKSVAIVASERLRQRSKFLQNPNNNPVLFIGCSVESLDIAEEIELGLKYPDLIVKIWKNGVFTASEMVINDLQNAVAETDFALFIFSPDDKVKSRSPKYKFAPRDNTIFELGLFMGKLEGSRTMILEELNSGVKIPTDLLGITKLTYELKKGGDLTTALSPVCTEIKKKVKKLGVR